MIVRINTTGMGGDTAVSLPFESKITLGRIFYCEIEGVECIGQRSTSMAGGGHGEGRWEVAHYSFFNKETLDPVELPHSKEFNLSKS